MRPFTIVLSASVIARTPEGGEQSNPIRVELPIWAEDVADAARVFGEALHVAVVRGSHGPVDDRARADVLRRPMRAATTEQREAFAVVEAPRSARREPSNPANSSPARSRP